MIQYRRSQFLLTTFETFETVGHDGALSIRSSLVLTSVLTGQHLLVSSQELEGLLQVPSGEWVDLEFLNKLGFTEDRISLFVDLGVLLTAPIGDENQRIRTLEDLLGSSHWPPCAAAFHLLNHYHESRLVPFGVTRSAETKEQAAESQALEFLAKHGPPPPAFYERSDIKSVDQLPIEILNTAVTQTLLNRRTARYFDRETPLSRINLAHLLRIVFGAFATRTLADRLDLLLKTSPSGGSLHPIEAFPFVFQAEGVRSGLYHYAVKSHSLGLLREMPEGDGRRLAQYFAQGQSFVGECSLVIILMARFERNFWKYQERENSYCVVMQDIGHLSQTFQIAATDLGLASFYTAALNSDALVDFLGLRYPAEAPVGLLGVGHAGPAPEASGLIEPYTPSRHA